MKTITLLAVVSMLLIDLFGTQSSIGGSMTDLLIVFLVVLAIGIYEAWSNKRGPLRWLLNIILALIGGLVAVSLCAMLMEAILGQIHFHGVLAKSDHPMRYITVVGMALSAVLGAWLPNQAINHIR